MERSILITMAVDDFKEVVSECVNACLHQYEAKNKTSNQEAGSDKLFTTEEACKLLDVSRPTLISWEKEGKLKPKRIGRRKFYLWSNIQKALQ